MRGAGSWMLRERSNPSDRLTEITIIKHSFYFEVILGFEFSDFTFTFSSVVQPIAEASYIGEISQTQYAQNATKALHIGIDLVTEIHFRGQ